MATALRPKQYHLRDSRIMWLLAIVRLHALGWNDPEIAEALSFLTIKDIVRLETFHLWQACKGSNVNACLEWNRSRNTTEHLPPWTTRQVRYYRQTILKLRPNKRRFEIGEDILTKTPGKLFEACVVHRRLYQTHRGWHHLLMRDPPVALVPRDVDLLCILHEHGEQDIEELACRFKSNRRFIDGHGRSRLARLRRLGLIDISGSPPQRVRIHSEIRPRTPRLSLDLLRMDGESVLNPDENFRLLDSVS